MMKHKYIKPRIKTACIHIRHILAGSDETLTGGGYGSEGEYGEAKVFNWDSPINSDLTPDDDYDSNNLY